MGAEVLKDFLVRLKYKVDAIDEKKYNTSVVKATKLTVGVAAAVAGAVTAIGLALHKFAEPFDQLYFMSKRTKASVKGIKATEYAMTQLGGSAEDADSSIRSLAAFMRNTPAAEGFLKGWGVQTRDVNNQLLQTDDILANIGTALADKPKWMQVGLGNAMGLSDEQMYFITSGKYKEFVDDFNRINSGVDFDKAAESANRFEGRMRKLGATIEGVKVSLGNLVFDFAEGAAKKGIFDAALPNKTPGVNSIFGGKHREFEPKKGSLKMIGSAPSSFAVASSQAAGANALGFKNNNMGNLNYAGQRGATPAGRFAAFGSAEEGAAALARQLKLYASRGLDTIESIISTYAPKKENNTKAYSDHVAKMMGAGVGDRLNLNDPAVLSKLMQSITTHELGGNPYSSSLFDNAARSVQVSQKTEIHIHEAKDAGATAKKVAREQDKVNSSLARNFAGARS